MTAVIITTAPTTSSQVYDWLRRRILTGDLSPGARLSETEIAGEIGVSRQPVREAFIRLASDGLAEVKPQRGTYIGKISVSAVMSARMIREAVESDLARIVAANPDKAVMDQMQGEIDQQWKAVEVDKVEEFIASDDRFHRLLAVGAGHDAAWAEMERMKWQMNRMRHLSMRVFDRASTIGQHQAILDALRAGDADAAEQHTRAHLRNILTELPHVAKTNPEFFTD